MTESQVKNSESKIIMLNTGSPKTHENWNLIRGTFNRHFKNKKVL